MNLHIRVWYNKDVQNNMMRKWSVYCDGRRKSKRRWRSRTAKTGRAGKFL